MSADLTEDMLKRMSIIEKAEALSWCEEVRFADGTVVNIDKSGNGTERFNLTHADIDDIYGYPSSSFYGPEDTDALSSWGCGNAPIIEKDKCSAELEATLDNRLRHCGIDNDNPVIQKLHPYFKTKQL